MHRPIAILLVLALLPVPRTLHCEDDALGRAAAVDDLQQAASGTKSQEDAKKAADTAYSGSRPPVIRINSNGGRADPLAKTTPHRDRPRIQVPPIGAAKAKAEGDAPPPPNMKAVWGATGGMLAGALIGFMIGGPIGAIIGALIGIMIGAYLGKKYGEATAKPQPAAAPAAK